MMRDALKTIGKEWRAHAPFTMFGTLAPTAMPVLR